MTSMRRRYVASTSLRRHVPAGNLAPLPLQYSKPCPPPNILNLPTPMEVTVKSLCMWTDISETSLRRHVPAGNLAPLAPPIF